MSEQVAGRGNGGEGRGGGMVEARGGGGSSGGGARVGDRRTGDRGGGDADQQAGWNCRFLSYILKVKQKKQIQHHARPRRASATAPLRTGADSCKTGSGAGKRSGAKSDPVRRRSNHVWTEEQAGRRKRANIDTVGGWRVHTADDTPSRNAATRSRHCNFMCQGDIRPRAAAGSSRNRTTQAVAATTGI